MTKKPPIKGASSFSELNDFLNSIAPDGDIIDVNPMAKKERMVLKLPEGMNVNIWPSRPDIYLRLSAAD